MKRKLEQAKSVFSQKVKKTNTEKEAFHPAEPNAEAGGCNETKFHNKHSSKASCSFTKFAGKYIGDLLFIEIFAGTARLSKVARDVGFQALPIDKTAARASQIFIAQYDLTDPQALQAITEILHTEKDRILAVHIAPACGTASKAREKKLTSLAKRGFKIPGPLRSQSKPMGLDGLSGLDKVRTETANMVYEATAQLVETCYNLNILCSVENPENSLFWFFPAVAKIMESIEGHSVSFHNCMHGGSRNKLTKWWATDDTFEELRVFCDNSHSHAKWNPTPVGKNLSFPTAAEAAYPILLCKRIMAILLAYATRHGAQDPVTLKEQLPIAATTSHRWILEMLPKGKKLKPLVSEFQKYVYFLNAVNCDPETTNFFTTQPRGTRIVQRQIQWGYIRVEEQENGNCFYWVAGENEYQLDRESPLLGKVGTAKAFSAELCTIGIPRDPWDFLARAIEVGHPRSLAIHLNEEVTTMLQQNFSGDLHLLVKERAAYLMKWTSRCRELETRERQLHESLEPHLQKVLEGKRLLVFQEMLDDLGYPDSQLVNDICKGFQLSGWLRKSGVFPPAFKRPAHDMNTAMKLAKGVNHGICKQVAEPAEAALNDEVWRQTEEELEKGWTWRDRHCDVKTKLLAKRFGLQQGEKVRLIDDCTIGGFNGTCGSSGRMRVHSVDEMAAYIAWCLTNLRAESMSEVVGKTYDLKNAYKQYGVCASDRDLLRLVVWNTKEKAVNFLGINALPFGAIGSVSAFLRVSMAVWYLGIRDLRLCWTSFFDDFTLLSKRLSSNSASIAAESLFNLLGIQFAQEGKKAVDWDTKVKTLGVQFDLKPMGQQGVVLLGHTENRIEELKNALNEFLQSGVMTPKDAERLRGRLQWYESFAGGRLAQQALRKISGLASSGRQKTCLSPPELRAIEFLRDRVLSAPPMRIQATNLRTWLVFSDGACEGEDGQTKEGTIGAILVSPEGDLVQYFSESATAHNGQVAQPILSPNL